MPPGRSERLGPSGFPGGHFARLHIRVLRSDRAPRGHPAPLNGSGRESRKRLHVTCVTGPTPDSAGASATATSEPNHRLHRTQGNPPSGRGTHVTPWASRWDNTRWTKSVRSPRGRRTVSPIRRGRSTARSSHNRRSGLPRVLVRVPEVGAVGAVPPDPGVEGPGAVEAGVARQLTELLEHLGQVVPHELGAEDTVRCRAEAEDELEVTLTVHLAVG